MRLAAGMRFGVSTLGCPGLPLRHVAELLHRHGVDAVQVRCAPDEPVHVGLGPAARRAARGELGGLTVLGLATYVRLDDGAAGLDAHLELAHDLGAPALRLMPGAGPAERAADTLAAALDRAGDIRLLVETHDRHLRGADLATILAGAESGARAGTGPGARAGTEPGARAGTEPGARAGTEPGARAAAEPGAGAGAAATPGAGAAGPGAGAVWDALHPWRAGESPAATAAALRPWLAEVQIKDVAAPDRRTPLAPGAGVIPLTEVLAEAVAAGFTGPVVLEHEARWYPDAVPLAMAIAGAQRVLAAFGR